MEMPTLEIALDGVPYVIESADIDGLEWRDIKRATDGMTPQRVFQAASEGDFEALAALLWIMRRRTEKVTFEQVLKGMSFRALTVEDDDVPPTSPDDEQD